MIRKFLIIFLAMLTAICICGSATALVQSTETEKTYTDLSDNPLETANQGDTLYGLISVHNGVPFSTQDMTVTGISNPQLTYQGTYQTSYDAGETWITNDGSFSPETGWQISIPGGNIYLLKQLFLVTGSQPDLTVTEGAESVALSAVQSGSPAKLNPARNTPRPLKAVNTHKHSPWNKNTKKVSLLRLLAR